MTKVKLRPIIKHQEGVWIVPYLVPSWCSSCAPIREIITIESKDKPTIEQIKEILYEYEIED